MSTIAVKAGAPDSHTDANRKTIVGNDGNEDQDEGSSRCGLWCIRGSILEKFNNFEFFLLLLSISGLCTGIQGALKSALLTKLEKRFHFNSKTSSLIVSANDMVFLPSVMLVSYFGSLGHRPRILALSCFGYGFASVLFAAPHFIFGSQATPREGADLVKKFGFTCDDNVTSTDTEIVNDNAEFESIVSLTIFIISGFIEGLSAAPYWNLGVAFVDDVTGSMSGVFIGLIIAARILSPSLGYQLYGKVIVRITENLERAEPHQLSHPRYIPAWWLGFVCIGSLAMLTAIPMSLFPRKPRFNARKYREGGRGIWQLCGLIGRRAERSRGGKLAKPKSRPRSRHPGEASDEVASMSCSGFFSALKRLLTNPVYITLLCGNMFEFMEINCVIAYMAKYLELHFRIPSGDASALTGLAVPGANAIGIAISSILASQVSWRVPQLARYHAIVNSFGILATASGLLFSCPTVQFLHSFQSYTHNPTFQPITCFNNSSFISNISSSSYSSISMLADRTNCTCSSQTFLPICVNGVNHFNPCSASCNAVKGKITCGCPSNNRNQQQLTFPIAQLRLKTGLPCPDAKCSSTVYLFIGIYFLTKLVRLSARSQEAVLQMRCVRQIDKALGLGVNSFAFSVGGIWVPIFVGYLFDKACIFSNPNKSEVGLKSSKSCLFYDAEKFRYSFCGFTTAALIPACVFFFLAWYFTEHSDKYTELDHVIKDETENAGDDDDDDGDDDNDGDEQQKQVENVGHGEVQEIKMKVIT